MTDNEHENISRQTGMVLHTSLQVAMQVADALARRREQRARAAAALDTARTRVLTGRLRAEQASAEAVLRRTGDRQWWASATDTDIVTATRLAHTWRDRSDIAARAADQIDSRLRIARGIDLASLRDTAAVAALVERELADRASHDAEADDHAETAPVEENPAEVTHFKDPSSSPTPEAGEDEASLRPNQAGPYSDGPRSTKADASSPTRTTTDRHDRDDIDTALAWAANAVPADVARYPSDDPRTRAAGKEDILLAYDTHHARQWATGDAPAVAVAYADATVQPDRQTCLDARTTMIGLWNEAGRPIGNPGDSNPPSAGVSTSEPVAAAPAPAWDTPDRRAATAADLDAAGVDPEAVEAHMLADLSQAARLDATTMRAPSSSPAATPGDRGQEVDRSLDRGDR